MKITAAIGSTSMASGSASRYISIGGLWTPTLETSPASIHPRPSINGNVRSIATASSARVLDEIEMAQAQPRAQQQDPGEQRPFEPARPIANWT